MFRLLIVIIIVLMPVLAGAQSIGVQWANFNLGLSDSSINLTERKAVAQFGISTILAGVKAGYTLTTGCSSAETVTPSGPLMVGSVDFGPQNQGVSAVATERRAVRLDWTVKPSHRIEFSRQIWRGISPLIIIRHDGLTLTATGEDSSGQATRGEETFSEWGLGIGAEFAAIMPNALARIKVAGLSDYLLVSLSYHQRMWWSSFIGAGYQYETIQFNNRHRLRKGAWLLNWEVIF